MSYVLARVLNGYEEEAWPTGMMGWAKVGRDKVYNDNFTDYWHHQWEETNPRVEFETKEECMEWLEDFNDYNASELIEKPDPKLKAAYDRYKEVFTEKAPTLTGGPAGYYDLPYKEWDTTNDMGEYLAKNRWFEYSLHFKDLLKALVRFGSKDGTTKRYDIEKMIYSGCRAMVMLAGREAVRGYLQKLLDDPQFKER